MSRKRKNAGIGADTWVHSPQGPHEGRRTAQKRSGRHRQQRADQGYSWYDWISFDTYLSGVVANAVRDFRLNGIGYPMGMSVQEWHDILLRIEIPLRRWCDQKFELGRDEELKAYNEAQDALRLFADHFGNMWD